jgi:hypothetical protein
MFDVDVDVDHIMKELLSIVLNTFAPAENNQAQTSTRHNIAYVLIASHQATGNTAKQRNRIK